jgi:PAS domain S-box-containing protein
MSKGALKPLADPALRLKAEEALAKKVSRVSPPTTTRQRTAHELRVYQIELEMQNEQLRQSQVALQASQARYATLYDQAPVGYLSLDGAGVIEQANLEASCLLGLVRDALLQRPLSDFVAPDEQDSFYLLRRSSALYGPTQTAEIRMVRADGAPFWAHLVANTANLSHGKDVLHLVLSDISERKRNELEREGMVRRIENLSRRLVQAQEEARKRLSRELHDRTSANLTALRLNLDQIVKVAGQAPDATVFWERVEDTLALIADTNFSIRDICAELHTPELDRGGLLEVVKSYAQQFTKRTGLPVVVGCAHGDMRLEPFLEVTLFRIVQECLTNCAKHASASTIHVVIALSRTPLRVAVVDDGCGFDTTLAATDARSGGHGLQNMRETAEFLGGDLLLESAPGRGTSVVVLV